MLSRLTRGNDEFTGARHISSDDRGDLIDVYEDMWMKYVKATVIYLDFKSIGKKLVESFSRCQGEVLRVARHVHLPTIVLSSKPISSNSIYHTV